MTSSLAVIYGKFSVYFEWWLRKKIYSTSAIKWLEKELAMIHRKALSNE
jgi:hypothetical protein